MIISTYVNASKTNKWPGLSHVSEYLTVHMLMSTGLPSRGDTATNKNAKTNKRSEKKAVHEGRQQRNKNMN